MTSFRTIAGVVFVLGAAAAACGSEGEPTKANYTLQFPSTEAAVATDRVQLLVFEVPDNPTLRATVCPELIAARKRRDVLTPRVQNQAVTICALLQGQRPIEVPFGEWAVLAIAQRSGQDFLYGCNIQTIGAGDAPLPIALSLANIGVPVPPTDCTSVAGFCTGVCQ